MNCKKQMAVITQWWCCGEIRKVWMLTWLQGFAQNWCVCGVWLTVASVVMSVLLWCCACVLVQCRAVSSNWTRFNLNSFAYKQTNKQTNKQTPASLLHSSHRPTTASTRNSQTTTVSSTITVLTHPRCNVADSWWTATQYSLLVVWHSGSVVSHNNKVTLRWARLELGWMTVFGRVYYN